MERFVLLVKFAQMLINWAIVDFYIAFCFVFYPVSQFVYKEEMFDKGMKYIFNFFLAFYAFFQEWCWFFFLHRNGYSGDACEDCLVASCFPCCASIQIANELDQIGTTRNGQAPIVTTQITINNPAPVQAPTIQVPYVPVAQAPIVQVPYGQAPPPPYKY